MTSYAPIRTTLVSSVHGEAWVMPEPHAVKLPGEVISHEGKMFEVVETHVRPDHEGNLRQILAVKTFTI